MRTFNMHQAKTHLSRLVAAAANGAPFIIASLGKPVVKAVPIEFPMPAATRRTGFLSGHICVPPDLDRMGSDEIEAMFGDSS